MPRPRPTAPLHVQLQRRQRGLREHRRARRIGRQHDAVDHVSVATSGARPASPSPARWRGDPGLVERTPQAECRLRRPHRPDDRRGCRLGSCRVASRDRAARDLQRGAGTAGVPGPRERRRPASPWPDGAVATSTCYQYRVGVLDNINNTRGSRHRQPVRIDHATRPEPSRRSPAFVTRQLDRALRHERMTGQASPPSTSGSTAGPASACTPTVAARGAARGTRRLPPTGRRPYR